MRPTLRPRRSGGRTRGPSGKSARRFLAFAIVTTLLTLAMGYRIAGSDFGPSLKIRATFDDVNGLRADDKVKIAGSPVGRVSSIKVVDGRALVTLSIRSSLRIPVDSAAVIRWRDVVGARVVYIEPGTSPVMAESGQSLSRTRSAADLGNLINDLGPMLGGIDPDDVNKILKAFSVALDGNAGKTNDIITNMSAMLKLLGSRSDTIKQMIGDYKTVTDALAARDRQIAQTIDNLTELTSAFADDRKALDTATVRLADLSGNLDKVLGGKSAELGRALEGTAGLMEVAHRNVGSIDKIIKGLPTALQALLSMTNGGNFLRANALCINVVYSEKCPFPMNLPPPPAQGDNRTTPAITPAEARLTPDQQQVFVAMVGLLSLGGH
ncbi:MlaD family protein [Actinocorallia longicatena]|uniref:Phospholipid/cholesterol/gamma-HCH transport system substrate-binding protein n=1 Tax=Actinocorallia longicatena TaxID=111803 RepID=A0ABP6Q4F2_9ACTN